MNDGMRITALLSVSLFALVACSTRPTAIGPIEALERAQHQSRVNAEARDYSRFAIARYAELTGDPVTAAQNYASLIGKARDNANLGERAVFASLLITDFETAADKASKISPDQLEDADLTRLTLAVDALALRNTKDAQTYLNGPWRSPFHSVIAQSLLAWSNVENDPDGAVKLQQTAGQSDPVLSGVARSLSGVMLANLDQDDAALTIFDTLWRENSRLALAVEAEARLLVENGDSEKALARLEKFRTAVGRHPALTNLTNQINDEQRVKPKRLSPREGAALAVYAATAALADQSDTDLPAVYFTLALKLDPDLDAARTLSARSLDNASRFADAEALLRKIPKSSIYHTSAQGQLAWILRRQGQNDEALALAKSTLDQTQDRNIRIQLADLYQSLGRDGEAEFVLTQTIDADKTDGTYDWRLYFARGAARERQGKWPPAENDLQTSLGLNPSSATVLNYLGYSWIDRGENLDQGLQLIERALRLNPSNGAISDSLGWAHYKLGNYDRAVFYLERATELSPQDPEILDHLGDAYWQVGRYTEAGYQWQRALQNLETDADTRPAIEAKLGSGLAMLSKAGANTTLP